MQTENSFHYFRGKEARAQGEGRGRGERMKNALARRSWLAGWDAEDAAQMKALRPAEMEEENNEARKWFDEEVRKWELEIKDDLA